ncbi:MAG TPA: hypothetical protein VN622_12930 [Clostridia bacterium]|nr:hypothetical protein [Clostridia bacterium]
MYGEKDNTMQCVDFDALLADALDGVLTGPKLASFEEHKAACRTCAEMFAEAGAGLNWLNALEEVEPPRNLVRNILIATTGTAEATGMAEVAARLPWWQRLRQRMVPQLAPVLTPRFAMSFGMAFFSISMVLNVSNIKLADLSPHRIRRTYYESEARVVKYYENIRLVYEIESRVRELKRAAGTESEPKKNGPKEQNKDNTDRDPDMRQYQNYSREADDAVVMAQAVRASWVVIDRRDV